MMIPAPFLLLAFFLGCAVGWVFGLIECHAMHQREMTRLTEEINGIVRRMPEHE